MNALAGFFAHLHPVVLHVPIGLLIGLGALELATWRRCDVAPRRAHALLAWLAAASAVLTAATGYALGVEESDRGDPLATHRVLGIATAAGSVLLATALAASRGATRRGFLALYRALLAATLVLLVPTGHLGGTMTHGEGYLFEPFDAPASRPASAPAPPPSDGAEASAAPAPPSYARTIAPILEQRCTPCHAAAQHKGSLTLTTLDGLRAGGKDGPIFSRERPDESLLLVRLHRPIDARGHMPPKEKPQLGASELAYVDAWARAVAAAGDPALPEPARSGPDTSTRPKPSGAASARARTASLAPADPAALAALRARLVHAQPIAQGSAMLWIDFSAPAARTGDDDVRALLEPVREQVSDLALSRSKITDASVAFLATLPRLRRLELRATAITDAGVAALRGHAALEELVLTETRVTDAALDVLPSLPALKRVYLWRTAATKEGLDRLRAARPGLAVDAGDAPAAAVVVVEDPVKVKNDKAAAAKPDATAKPAGVAPAAPASLDPVNTACPVSGEPVAPGYRIVFEGRVIGFCCPNCPAKFWASPETYRAKLP